MRKWTRMLILFLLLTLLPGIPALAEDVCTVKDAMTASCITTDRAYLRLHCLWGLTMAKIGRASCRERV